MSPKGAFLGIVLQRNGVLVSMYGCPPQPLEAIKSYMTYDKRETVAERGRIKTAIVPTRFWFEQDGVLIFPCGFIPRVCGIAGLYKIPVESYHRFDREPRLDYDLSGVDVCGLRPEQEKMLEAFVENEGGQIISPTGSGKSWGLRELCCLYPNARIIVAAPGRETTATMKRYLVDKFGEDNIGQVGGGKRHTRRITCTTYDSVLKVEDLHKVDILIADEGHRSPAVKYEQRFMSVTSPVKRFMFTATPEGRSDNAELTMEALFGPQVVNIAYQDTVKSGSVLPIHVIVKDQPHGPDEQTVRQIPVGPKRDRVCIWRNNDRNKMIVEDVLETMKQYEDPQVLILVDKTEHALVLKSLLPDFHMVHGELDAKRKARLIKQGLLGMGEKTMSSKERDAAREAFESGALKRVLATQVFATGVSSNHCQIVGIASGTGSIIQFLQSIGRAGRKCDEIGKTHATVLVWRDTFAKSYTARAAKLVSAARKQGHKITRVQWIPK